MAGSADVHWQTSSGALIDLAGGRSGENGVVLEKTGDGFFHPPRTVLTTSSAYQHGGRAGRSVYAPREFDLTLRVQFGAPGAVNEQAFWSAFSSESSGTLVVKHPLWGARSLDCFVPEAPTTVSDGREPDRTRWVQVVVPLVAVDPFFHGEPEAVEVVFSGAGTKSVHVVNQGDRPAHPVYTTSTGGTWVFPDGVEGRAVTVHTMPRRFSVFTSPHLETLLDESGLPMYEHLRWEDFRRSIPPGFVGDVSITAPGAGSVRVSVPQVFSRPWA